MSDPIVEAEPTQNTLQAYSEQIMALSKANTATGVSTSTWQSPDLAFESVPTTPIRKRQVTEEQARSLAVTRRHRLGEFSAGAFIASLPGSIQTVLDYRASQVVPNSGHLVEIGLAVLFFGLTARSFFDFTEPTSREAFHELFPNSKHGLSFAQWCGCKVQEFKKGLSPSK